jgi:transposase-like protein
MNSQISRELLSDNRNLFMQYSQEKREEILQLLAAGGSPADVHEFTGVPLSTIYRWRDENSREKPSENSREKLDKIIEFLKNTFAPQLISEIKAAEEALEGATGTFTEKMYISKLNKLRDKLSQLEAL